MNITCKKDQEIVDAVYNKLEELVPLIELASANDLKFEINSTDLATLAYQFKMPHHCRYYKVVTEHIKPTKLKEDNNAQ